MIGPASAPSTSGTQRILDRRERRHRRRPRPPSASWARRLEAEEQPQDRRGHGRADPRSLPLERAMNRTLIARKPTAMTRTTSRLGIRPSFSAAVEGVPGEGQRAQREGQGQARRQHAPRGSARDLSGLGQEHPRGQGDVLFLPGRDRGGDEGRPQDQVLRPQAPEFLRPVLRTWRATTSTRSRTAQGEDGQERPGNPRRCGRRGRAYWPRALPVLLDVSDAPGRSISFEKTDPISPSTARAGRLVPPGQAVGRADRGRRARCPSSSSRRRPSRVIVSS
ncbi:MAG: hypothetical protein MZV64_11340 [Ignavibacteriales bacterium]|nr:hypothetical protein [Ignavibacteriales bacterium]